MSTLLVITLGPGLEIRRTIFLVTTLLLCPLSMPCSYFHVTLCCLSAWHGGSTSGEMSRINTTTIKEYAYSIGFDMVRITSAEEFAEAEQVIKERIAQGLMDGLPWFTTERASVSCHPH